MSQPQEPTLGDMVMEDLERQLSESDPRYGRKCRELAVIRAQYTQLMTFVQSKKDVLGLTMVDENGKALDAEPDKSTEVTGAEKSSETTSLSVNGAKAPAKEAAKTSE